MLGLNKLTKLLALHEAKMALKEPPRHVIPLETPNHPNPVQAIRDMLPHDPA